MRARENECTEEATQDRAEAWCANGGVGPLYRKYGRARAGAAGEIDRVNKERIKKKKLINEVGRQRPRCEILFISLFIFRRRDRGNIYEEVELKS